MKAGAVGLVLLGAVLLLGMGESTMRDDTDPNEAARERMRELVKHFARQAGVPVPVALAFAEVESNFAPNREGDRDWPTRNGGALYRRMVRDAAHFASNPYRNDPDRWHAYGLFQLLAPYYTGPTESPLELLKPDVNAQRALKTIAALLLKYAGDDELARIHYVCGSLNCSDAKRAQILTRYRAAKARYQGVA